MKSLSSVFAFLALVFLIGCKSNSTTPSNGSGVVIPGLGTVYVFDDINRDANNVVTSHDTETMRFVKTNASFGGFNDAAAVTDTYSDQPGQVDTIFFRFLPNGDVAIALGLYLGPNNAAGWLLLPFASQTPQTFQVDTSYLNGLSVEFDSSTITTQYSGSTTLSVGGQSIAMNETTVGVSGEQVSGGAVLYSSDDVTIIPYSSAMGVLGGNRQVTNTNDGANQGLSTSTLISYTVK